MAAWYDSSQTPAQRHGLPTDWCVFEHHARMTLEGVLRATGILTPKQVARVVAGVLPDRLRDAMLNALHQHGWLDPNATIPFDILDGPACPAEFSGQDKEFVRLALFGLPGQGLAWRDRHRHDVFQRICAEIMSSAVDTASLQAVSSRAMNHPDVCADATLASMLRSFIAEREAALRAARSTPGEQQREQEERSKLFHGFTDSRPTGFPSREQLLDRFARMQREYEGYLASFEESRAQRVLQQMRDLRKQYPVHITAAELQEAEEKHDRLMKRIGAYRRQINELATKGCASARDGDFETANWVIKRLQAIHELLPNLLTLADVKKLRNAIADSGRDHETEEAVYELVEKKREVAGQIKRLAGIIHRFHQLATKLSPDDPAYRRAEANYQKAIEEIRGLDTEWLTGLVLQLENFLQDLEDPDGIMQNKLDKFIANVRTALNRLILEIREHRKNQGKRNHPGTDAPPEPTA